MDLQQAVKSRVVYLCKKQNISINKLATLSGMSQSTVNSLVDGTSQNPKLLTIIRMCFGFNITIKEFVDDPIFNDIDDD